MLIIDGTELKGRHLVILDGDPIYLTHAVFMVLLRMAARKGWANKYDIESNGNAGRYLYRLKKESDGRIRIENNGRDCYRIKNRTKLNLLALFKLEDGEIKQLCRGGGDT